VVSGLVTGLFSLPEGMAYASIGGFNPVAGLYSGMLPTLAGSVFARTVLMVTTLTSAIALSSHSVLASAHLDPHRPANIAALVIVVAAVMAAMGLLIAGRVPDIKLVARTSVLSAVAMVVTFAATTQFALQDAIFLGAVLSLLLYCVQAARQADLIALEPTGQGGWRTTGVPSSCPSGQVTVIFYNGVGLFAEVPRLDERWPDLSETRDAVLIVSMRTLPDVPSSTVIKALEKRVRTLTANGSKLMIVGVTPEVARILDRSGLTQLVGKDNVIPATDEIFGALDRAMDDARRWIADHSADPASPGSAP
jgi:SulP family sulfate permease